MAPDHNLSIPEIEDVGMLSAAPLEERMETVRKMMRVVLRIDNGKTTKALVEIWLGLLAIPDPARKNPH